MFCRFVLDYRAARIQGRAARTVSFACAVLGAAGRFITSRTHKPLVVKVAYNG